MFPVQYDLVFFPGLRMWRMWDKVLIKPQPIYWKDNYSLAVVTVKN